MSRDMLDLFQEYQLQVTNPCMNMTDIIDPSCTDHYSSLARAFGLSSDDQLQGFGTNVVNTTPPPAPNSSSSSSTEAETFKDDQNSKGSEDGHSEKTKKKKGEKRARFAFMTKSEVDHLEDGYRWRKYGQKAVKNSSFPRSYYRCTTQKCTVKKRVERSYEDPSMVITTYEGEHSHQIPTTLRGNMYQHQHPNIPMFHTIASPSLYLPQHDQFHRVEDNGLLQDIVPSMFLNHHHD